MTHRDRNARIAAVIDSEVPHAIEKALAAPKKLICKQRPICDQCFRKTFATKLHHGGTRLKDLQQWLGYKSLSTTEHYLAGSDLKATHVRQQIDAVFAFGD